MDCKNFEKNYWLIAYEEADPGGDDGLNKHLQSCPDCRAKKEELDRIKSLLDAHAALAPEQEMLFSARRLLRGRLRDRKEGVKSVSSGIWIWERLRGTFEPAWRPAFGLGLVLIGLIIGRFIIQPHPYSFTDSISPVSSGQSASFEQRYIAESLLKDRSRIQDIKVKSLDPASGLVQVDFSAVQEYRIQGDPSEKIIGDLLAWSVKNETNSGVRLQSVEELARVSNMSAPARQALVYALINDENPGVRLKALQALGKAPWDKLTEQAILSALLKDTNPAVRISAIDMILSQSEESPTSEGTWRPEPYLLQAAESDSNDYVRMRARQAIRQTNFNYEFINVQR